MNIPKWVLAARKHKGWTQTQLGDALSVTKGNVSGWEKARHQPSYHQLAKIAEVTGYPLVNEVSTIVWPFKSLSPEQWVGLPREARESTEDALLRPTGIKPNGMSLRDVEHDLVEAFRLLNEPEQIEAYMQILEMVRSSNAPIQQTMERLNVAKHYDRTKIRDALAFLRSPEPEKQLTKVKPPKPKPARRKEE